MMTKLYGEISNQLIASYISRLVDRFYKILPLKEEGEVTLPRYLEGLAGELLGFQRLSEDFNTEERFITLLSILQYMIDYHPGIKRTRTEVFRAIKILKDLQDKYAHEEV